MEASEVEPDIARGVGWVHFGRLIAASRDAMLNATSRPWSLFIDSAHKHFQKEKTVTTTESSRFAEHPAPKSNGDMDQTWAPLSYKNGRLLAILDRFMTGLALMLKLPEGLRTDYIQAFSALEVHTCGAEQSSSGPMLRETTRPV